MAESGCSNRSTPVSQEESSPISSIANSVRNLTLTPKSSRVSISFRQARQIHGRVLFTESKKESSPKKTSVVPNWSSEEYQALVSFLLLYTSGLSWSSCARKDTKFWAEAGVFMQQQTKSLHCRSGIKLAYTLYSSTIYCVCMHAGKACRSKVTVTLRKEFQSPAAAEKFYQGTTLPSQLNCQTPSTSPVPMDTQLPLVSAWIYAYLISWQHTVNLIGSNK